MGMAVGIALMWFVIEMLVWYLIAQFVSGWWVFLWFVVAFVLGLSLIKKCATTINPMAQQMKAGVIPNPANSPSEATITKSVAMGLAGILFVLPGVLSDIGAFILLVPAVQKKLADAGKNYAMKNQAKMMELMAKQMGGNSPFGNMGAMGGMGGNPFGGQNPFGAGSPFGGSPFGGGKFGGGTTVDGEAKPVNPSVKKITSANDE